MPRPPPPATALIITVFFRNYAVASGRDGHTGFARKLARQIFVAHRAHRTGWRPDEMNVTALAYFGEMRVLGQKPVTGMNRVDIAHLGGAHDAIDFQITFRARGRPNANRFIRQLDVERIDIRFRIDCEGANTKFSAGANDA